MQMNSNLAVASFQAFANSNLPLKKLDFSHNAIRRLADKVFAGIQEELMELHLTDNLLGDTLNPIFSTAELHALTNLRVLHLSGNKIKAIEEGLLRGCEKLQVNTQIRGEYVIQRVLCSYRRDESARVGRWRKTFFCATRLNRIFCFAVTLQ